MGYVRQFVLFWYDFLVGDAWDIAAGVVVALAVLAVVARAQPGAGALLGPLLALAVVALTWLSLRRELRR
ncbi:MAG TPA: hypothetical protein VFC93_10105 [Chloroflexota bacterium]|jgi:hypothetical protein|nr:hypothetical protein [Chloroflexota bacterium]